MDRISRIMQLPYARKATEGVWWDVLVGSATVKAQAPLGKGWFHPAVGNHRGQDCTSRMIGSMTSSGEAVSVGMTEAV